jgi:hypothetical protein
MPTDVASHRRLHGWYMKTGQRRIIGIGRDVGDAKMEPSFH